MVPSPPTLAWRTPCKQFYRTFPIHVRKMLSTSFCLCQSPANYQLQDDDFKYRGKREVEALPEFNEVKIQLVHDVEVPGEQGKETKPSVLSGPPKPWNMLHFIFVFSVVWRLYVNVVLDKGTPATSVHLLMVCHKLLSLTRSNFEKTSILLRKVSFFASHNPPPTNSRIHKINDQSYL